MDLDIMVRVSCRNAWSVEKWRRRKPVLNHGCGRSVRVACMNLARKGRSCGSLSFDKHLLQMGFNGLHDNAAVNLGKGIQIEVSSQHHVRERKCNSKRPNFELANKMDVI